MNVNSIEKKLALCNRRLDRIDEQIGKLENDRDALWEKEEKLENEKRLAIAKENIGKYFSNKRYHMKIEGFENNRIIVTTVTRNSIILGSPQHSLPDDIEPCSELVFKEAVSKVVGLIKDVLITGNAKTKSVVCS